MRIIRFRRVPRPLRRRQPVRDCLVAVAHALSVAALMAAWPFVNLYLALSDRFQRQKRRPR